MPKLLLFFLFVVAVAAVFFGWYWWQGTSFSKEVLKLDLTGPDEAAVGEEIEYTVKLKNNGDVRLEQAEISFEYPESAILESSDQQITTQEIGVIYPGDEKTFSFKCRLFGKEGDKAEARVLVTYQPKNLQAKYDRKNSLVTTLKEAPLTFEFDMPLRANNGESVDIFVNYFSNIEYPLDNLRMKIEYPTGFSFISSVPKALDGTEWSLPALTQANGGRVEIAGVLEGDEGDKEVFTAQIGVLRDGEFIVIKEASGEIEIAQAPLYISQLINSSQNYTAQAGEILHYEVFFRNIGKKPVQKNFLVVKLNGNYFDLSSIRATDGDNSSGDSSIFWDWKTVSDLSFLDAGEEGKVEFWVKVKDVSDLSSISANPMLTNNVVIGGVEKSFEIKLSSAVDFAQKIYYQDDIFGNAGPLPPQVGKTTTYTVLWQIRNSWNDLENVKIKTTLPKNVTVNGEYFPNNAKFTYDSTSREVVWSVGALSKGTNTPITLAFQIEFTPDSSQKGSTALLIGESEISGDDVFTDEVVKQKALSVNTSLPDDPNVSQNGVITN